MTGRVGVEPGELDAHSKQVSGIADELAQATSAGQSATPLGSDAFGIIGQAFATIAQSAVSAAVLELQVVTQAARELSGGVGRAGEAYRQTDDGAKRRVLQAQKEL